uniref:Transcription elongation factor SPT5-like n=1 Tax=Diabrotica virgifera virgifera TaxID=50390 RepID=A0A6P7GDW5_DIAVI
MPDLVAVCSVLDLNYTGSEDDVIERICSFLNDFNLEDESDDEDEDASDDAGDKGVYHKENGKDVTEDDSEDEDNDVNSDKDAYHEDEEEGKDVTDDDSNHDDNREDKRTTDLYTRNKSKSNKMTRGRLNDSFALTFRDIEDSIRNFDGKDDYPIGKWITYFEEISNLMGWNDLQMLIFSKRSLKGIAKLYIQSEKGVNSWKLLKKRQTTEFENKVSSAEIHKMLMNRKKKQGERLQEYVLKMREIGSRGNIENEVIMQYIIEGIMHDPANKVILYGAKNFNDFKEKIKLYELIKKQTTQKSVKTETH